MMIGKRIKIVATFLIGNTALSFAFTTNSHTSRGHVDQRTSTELHIIGPIIRKIREERAKKDQPLASLEELSSEAPGLKVGTGAWKWPPIWPYDGQAFMRKSEIIPVKPPMAGLLSGGMPSLPNPSVEEIKPLDVMQYWNEEKGDVTTEIDLETEERLRNHYGFYLKNGMSVIEFGAAEKSYLPENLVLARHVGVGASKSLMEKNGALSQILTVDLNDVVPGEGLKSDLVRDLGENNFDVVLMANTIEFLTSPIDLFRTAWKLLKPGGIMIVSFVNKDAFASKFEQAQTKIWLDTNNDQHIWICGSFFQFSAGEGWDRLQGFDISPDSATKNEGIMRMIEKNKKMNMYVVQAVKVAQDQTIDTDNAEKSFRTKMWVLPVLEERDKQLVAPRLARTYTQVKNPLYRQSVETKVNLLPKIYEILIKMDQFSFSFSMQAQLASDLISDPDFTANDRQIRALKMGLGLRSPSKEFWDPLGKLTSNMKPEDKISCLACIVPRFGSYDIAVDQALKDFISGLEPTFAVIRSKCLDMDEADIEYLGTELLIAEILRPGNSSKDEFASWIGAMNDSELRAILKSLRSSRDAARDEMTQMQDERRAEQERVEMLRKKMVEQQSVARKDRSIVFNTRTGKLEVKK